MRPTTLALLPVFLLFLAPLAAAWATPNGVEKVTSVEGITEYTLDNGLQVLLFPDQSKSTITVNVTYRVGSRHEGRGEAGMAHLLEHMVFKGTPTYPNIWGALEDHGATFNGTTWVDRTNYFETLPANDENLVFAISMEADRMVNSDIADEELAKEMTVVRNEFERGENNPSGVLSERMMSAAYLWHNYGKSTIGNRSDIERVPGENLRRFYRKYYQPDNATLLVAGKFDEENVLRLIADAFGSIPKPERVLDQTYTEEPAQDGPRAVTLMRVGDVAAIGLIYHVPAGTHPEFPAVQILEDVLTGQPSGRLYRKLVVPGLASSVSGSAFAWAEPGVIEFSGQVASDQSPESVLQYMIDTVESVAKANITEEEVERAKRRALKAIKLAMTDSGRIGIRLSESIAQGDWRLFFIHRDRLGEVSLTDVQRVANKYLTESNRTSGMFIPTKEAQRISVPGTPDVGEMVKNYTGSQTIAEGEAFANDVTSIESRIRRVTLPSGIRVALLAKQNRGNSVNASFHLHFGDEDGLTGKTTDARMIASMLMRGTTSKDYQQLRDEIDRIQSQISVGGGGGGHGRRGGGGGGGTGLGDVQASIESDRDNIVESIRLVGEIFMQPAFDPKEFEILAKAQRSRLEQGLSDPMMLAMTEMRRALDPWPADHVHYAPTIDEQIERLDAVSLDSVKALHDKYYGARNMEVAIVGDFDQEQVLTAIEDVFGKWDTPAPYTRIAKVKRPYDSASLKINTPDKEMAMVGMGAVVEMRDDDPDYPAMVLAGYVLGQSAKSRLMNRLRHEGGLSYGAGGSFNADSEDNRATLMTYAICAPRNARKALDAMREEVSRWITEGITDEELAEAKQSYALRFERSLASDNYLLDQLVTGLKLDRTLEYQRGLQEKIQQLSVADIRAALTKTLGDVSLVEMMAGDLERGAAESSTESDDKVTAAGVQNGADG